MTHLQPLIRATVSLQLMKYGVRGRRRDVMCTDGGEGSQGDRGGASSSSSSSFATVIMVIAVLCDGARRVSPSDMLHLLTECTHRLVKQIRLQLKCLFLAGGTSDGAEAVITSCDRRPRANVSAVATVVYNRTKDNMQIAT